MTDYSKAADTDFFKGFVVGAEITRSQGLALFNGLFNEMPQGYWEEHKENFGLGLREGSSFRGAGVEESHRKADSSWKRLAVHKLTWAAQDWQKFMVLIFSNKLIADHLYPLRKATPEEAEKNSNVRREMYEYMNLRASLSNVLIEGVVTDKEGEEDRQTTVYLLDNCIPSLAMAGEAVVESALKDPDLKDPEGLATKLFNSLWEPFMEKDGEAAMEHMGFTKEKIRSDFFFSTMITPELLLKLQETYFTKKPEFSLENYLRR